MRHLKTAHHGVKCKKELPTKVCYAKNKQLGIVATQRINVKFLPSSVLAPVWSWLGGGLKKMRRGGHTFLKKILFPVKRGRGAN